MTMLVHMKMKTPPRSGRPSHIILVMGTCSQVYQLCIYYIYVCVLYFVRIHNICVLSNIMVLAEGAESAEGNLSQIFLVAWKLHQNLDLIPQKS